MAIVMNPTDIQQDVIDAIQMTRMCQALQCLPGSGGLLDQDSYHIWLMDQVFSADAEAEKRKQLQSK